MTLKQLQAFYWAAVSASFQVAAERLHISQSSLSKRVAELESELRKPLFDRSGHRATLNEVGEQLLPLAQRILGLTDEVTALLADERAIRGRCRFGVGELAALTWLPLLVAHVNDHHPELALEPFVDVGLGLEQRVDEGEFDFAVIAGYSSRTEVASEPIATVQLDWAIARELVGESRNLTPEMFDHNALISMPPRATSARLLERWLSANGWGAPRRMYCNNLSAIASLVASGVGIGLLPNSWIHQLAAKGTVIQLSSTPRLPILEYTFQRRKDDTRPIIAAMRQAVLATVDFEHPNSLW